MTRERANFSVGHHVTRQLLGVVGLPIALSHCHVFAAKLQGLPSTGSRYYIRMWHSASADYYVVSCSVYVEQSAKNAERV